MNGCKSLTFTAQYAQRTKTPYQKPLSSSISPSPSPFSPSFLLSHTVCVFLLLQPKTLDKTPVQELL